MARQAVNRISLCSCAMESLGCFNSPQVREMAFGLERSGHQFLWALCIHIKDADASLDEVLPEGS